MRVEEGTVTVIVRNTDLIHSPSLTLHKIGSWHMGLSHQGLERLSFLPLTLTFNAIASGEPSLRLTFHLHPPTLPPSSPTTFLHPPHDRSDLSACSLSDFSSHCKAEQNGDCGRFVLHYVRKHLAQHTVGPQSVLAEWTNSASSSKPTKTKTKTPTCTCASSLQCETAL